MCSNISKIIFNSLNNPTASYKRFLLYVLQVQRTTCNKTYIDRPFKNLFVQNLGFIAKLMIKKNPVNWLIEIFRQKDGMNVTDSRRVYMGSDSDGNAELIIRSARTSDSGLYCVIAQNSAGRTKCSAYLRVKGQKIHKK